jgi:nucleotide-binding universal stress UspA family protein
MYSKVLVPLDGSKTAENVLPYARCFARSLQMPVELMAVVDAIEMDHHVSVAESSDALIDDETRRCGNYLQQVAKNFPVSGARCTVEKGKAADVIIESAAAEKETLIAMATHGRSGLNRWLMGSVAEKVLRGSSNPLLLVRATEQTPPWEMAALKRVIVPLDGSESSERVLPYVEALAKHLNLDVTLLDVYGVPFAAGGNGEGFYNSGQMDALIAGLRAETVTYLAVKTEELKRKGFNKISFKAKEGHVADGIIAMARETPDTLIAMCSHGRAGVKRWVLGSVTETVVRHSDNPVLVVRAGRLSSL